MLSTGKNDYKEEMTFVLKERVSLELSVRLFVNTKGPIHGTEGSHY